MGQKVNPIGFRLGNVSPTVLYADKDHKYLSQALTIQEIIEDIAIRRGIIIYDFKFNVASSQIKILLKCFNTCFGYSEELTSKNLPVQEIKAFFQPAFKIPIKDIIIHELEDQDLGNDLQLDKSVTGVVNTLYRNIEGEFVFHVKKEESEKLKNKENLGLLEESYFIEEVDPVDVYLEELTLEDKEVEGLEEERVVENPRMEELAEEQLEELLGDSLEELNKLMQESEAITVEESEAIKLQESEAIKLQESEASEVVLLDLGSEYNTKFVFEGFSLEEIEALPIEETDNLLQELEQGLKNYSKYEAWFSDWVTLMNNMVYKPEPKLLAMFAKELIERNDDVSDLLLCRLLQESIAILEEFTESKDYLLPLRGFYIQFKGRVGGKARSGKERFGFGVLKPHRVDSQLKYHYTNYQTKYGTSSIKVWMSLNNVSGLSFLETSVYSISKIT